MKSWHDPVWGLHGDLIEALDLLEVKAAKKGIAIDRVTSGARTFHRQALLWTTYRRSPLEARQKYGVVAAPAAPGASRHHAFYDGLAVACDLKPVAATEAEKATKLRELGKLAGECGLAWGGFWQNSDPVHFELVAVNGAPVDFAGALLDVALKIDALLAQEAS